MTVEKRLSRLGDLQAQATVEAAIVLPILIVLALIVYNLMMYSCMCARFDRIVKDCVIACAISPAGEGTDSCIEQELITSINEAMGNYEFELEVESVNGAKQAQTVLELLGAPNEYLITLKFTPWPHTVQIAGINAQMPLELSHKVCVTIDPWRPGVVA